MRWWCLCCSEENTKFNYTCVLLFFQLDFSFQFSVLIIRFQFCSPSCSHYVRNENSVVACQWCVLCFPFFSTIFQWFLLQMRWWCFFGLPELLLCACRCVCVSPTQQSTWRRPICNFNFPCLSFVAMFSLFRSCVKFTWMRKHLT